MSKAQAETEARSRANDAARLKELNDKREKERAEYQKRTDDYFQRQYEAYSKIKTVPFVHPTKNANAHRSSGTPSNKAAPIFFADASSAAQRFNEQHFQGYGGMKCDAQAILRGESAMNTLKEEKYATGAKIINGMHNDIEWGCALEHIQPSASQPSMSKKNN